MELNNKFGQCCSCPGLMSDGRLFTSYKSNSELNNSIMDGLGVKDSNEYRKLLQKNGESIIIAIHTHIDSQLKCLTKNTNNFYGDIDINKHFDEEMKKTILVQNKINY